MIETTYLCLIQRLYSDVVQRFLLTSFSFFPHALFPIMFSLIYSVLFRMFVICTTLAFLQESVRNDFVQVSLFILYVLCCLSLSTTLLPFFCIVMPVKNFYTVIKLVSLAVQAVQKQNDPLIGGTARGDKEILKRKIIIVGYHSRISGCTCG